MGEMADFANDIHMDECEALENYHSGTIDVQEAYDRGIIDEYGSETQQPTARDLNPFISARNFRSIYKKQI